MGKTSKPIVVPTERRWRDAVTGEDHVLILDDVQKAYERIKQTVDGQMVKLSTEQNLKLVTKLFEMLEDMVPHT